MLQLLAFFFVSILTVKEFSPTTCSLGDAASLLVQAPDEVVCVGDTNDEFLSKHQGHTEVLGASHDVRLGANSVVLTRLPIDESRSITMSATLWEDYASRSDADQRFKAVTSSRVDWSECTSPMYGLKFDQCRQSTAKLTDGRVLIHQVAIVVTRGDPKRVMVLTTKAFDGFL